MSPPPFYALILGASGISGWALLNQARLYPSPDTFHRITGTTNRPLSLEKAQIPPDPRVRLVSGIDFTKSVEEVRRTLKEKIPDVDTVTHIFLTAYIHLDEHQPLKKVNDALLRTSITAIDTLCPNLEVVILQTGGKGYGPEFRDAVGISIVPPLKESLPGIPQPYDDSIFYYSQYDILESLSRGRKWTFSEIRPDGIIGFVPGGNAMNLAQGIGLYLALWKEVYGKGVGVPFPGTEKGWVSTHNDTSQDLLAKMEVYAAPNPEICGGGRAFNIADGRTVRWAEVWPELCEDFGLLGAGPTDGGEGIVDFVERNESVWEGLVKREGLRGEPFGEQNWGLVHFMLVDFGFDREYDLSRAREVGFMEEIVTVEGYRVAWGTMKTAKILPA